MILGFIFSPTLKENLIPILLILLSVGVMTSGIAIKSKMLLFSGLFINLSAFVCYNLDWIYHPLLIGIVSLVAVFTPGMLLMIQHKSKANV
jgi:hypothetical protein